MSFVLRLDVADLTEEQGRRVAECCVREGAWPVRLTARRRRFPWSSPTGPMLSVPERCGGEDLLSDQATWDADAWAMNEQQLPAFAAAIEILGRELTQGFALRATWVGSEVRHERVLTVRALAELARRSELNEFTRYVVPPSEPSAG